MSASDVDRLRADLAVLDRRIDRIERSAAMAMDGFTAMRKRLEAVELAGTTRGGSAAEEGSVGVEQLEPLHADLATLREEMTGFQEEVGGVAKRLERLEDVIRAQRVGEAPGAPGSPTSAVLGDLKDEVEALRRMVVSRQPTAPADDAAISALREGLEELRVDVAALRRDPTPAQTTSPEPEAGAEGEGEPEGDAEPDSMEAPAPQAPGQETQKLERSPGLERVAEAKREADRRRAEELARAQETDPQPVEEEEEEEEGDRETPEPRYRAVEPDSENDDPDTENEPLADDPAPPLEEDPADTDSDLEDRTSVFIQPPPTRQRSDTMVEGMMLDSDEETPELRDAHWSHEILRVNAPVTMRCEAPGHPDDTPAEIIVEGTEQDEVARMDAVVTGGSVRAVWRYRYADDPNTARAEPRFRFVVRIGDLEAHSDFAEVQGWNPPPKKMGFADMLRRKR